MGSNIFLAVVYFMLQYKILISRILLIISSQRIFISDVSERAYIILQKSKW